MLGHQTLARPVVLIGMTLTLVAPAACSSATAPAERVYTLKVAPARAPCAGVAPQQCFQVREGSNAPYTLFYDAIQGFTYEPGYWYVLEVGERSVANPPADGSSKSYRLISIVSRAPASP